MTRENVIMPTEEEMADFAAEGRARQRKRGTREILFGILAVLVGLVIMLAGEPAEAASDSPALIGAAFGRVLVHLMPGGFFIALGASRFIRG